MRIGSKFSCSRYCILHVREVRGCSPHAKKASWMHSLEESNILISHDENTRLRSQNEMWTGGVWSANVVGH